MQRSYEALQDDLSALSSTHPGLARVWKEYMDIRHRKFLRDMVACREMVRRAADVPDMSPDQIAATAVALNMVLANNT